ncbi:hypothetical protein DLJ49_03275 [Rhodovulum sp. 12E13]|uniref:hypothetical protein n=1 Tax=Rhodovulum sp. 12E13 TaxID=2203891 RepID=UPI000E12CA65|nr:hypothetical protein [Rhodovulum sp. 12E13]RDC74334.1 hypothetical protein DLJ49_03275 [Rhodovulum sp. 12E13]
MSDLALLAFALTLGLASRAPWFGPGRGTPRRPAEPPAPAELALWSGLLALAASLLAARALF